MLWGSLFNEFGRKFKSSDNWFYACGSSAASKPFCFMLAEVPPRSNHFVLCLRKFRGTQTILFYARGSSVALKPFCFMLAEVPPRRNHFVLYLRKFRGVETILFYTCGSSAALKPFCFMLAEVPPRSNHFVLCSRKFRKTQTIWFYPCTRNTTILHVWYVGAGLRTRLDSRMNKGLYAGTNSGSTSACRDRPRVCPHLYQFGLSTT